MVSALIRRHLRKTCLSSLTRYGAKAKFRRSVSSSAASVAVGPSRLEMPVHGCGTAVFEDHGINQKNLSPQYAKDIVTWALDGGYRLIDTAYMYNNQEQIGSVLAKLFSSGELKRDDVFISTKIAHPNVSTHQDCDYVEKPELDAYQGAAKEIELCFEQLQVDVIDAMMIHWPGKFENKDAETGKQKRAAIWRALEDAYTAGKIKAIGVSNFEIKHLEQLSETWKVKPMVNQIECHPYLNCTELLEYLNDEGIVSMAYCPLGSGLLGVLEDEHIRETALKHAKSMAQVVLRWHIQRGVVPIPKSSSQDRIKANYDVMDFELSKTDMMKLSMLNRNLRVCPDPRNIM